RARPAHVVGTVRVVGHVEVDDQLAVRPGLRVQVAANRVGFLAGGAVPERKEELPGHLVLEHGEGYGLAVHLEGEAAKADILLRLTGERSDGDFLTDAFS